MFPRAVMTAPSTAFMAAGLWRLSVRGHVHASIRPAGEGFPCLPAVLFFLFFCSLNMINTTAVLYIFTLRL